MRGISWVIAIAGVWEILAPFILGFSNLAAGVWNNVIVGILLIIFGAWAALSANVGTGKTLDWISAVLGLWLVVSPFILGTAVVAAALWNDIIVGVIVIILGVWAALSYARPVA